MKRGPMLNLSTAGIAGAVMLGGCALLSSKTLPPGRPASFAKLTPLDQMPTPEVVVIEPPTHAIALQYGASYPLIQRYGSGEHATGQWTALKGLIVDNKRYIAPHGQVYLDRDTLTYTPAVEDIAAGYDIETYELLLTNSEVLPLDKASPRVDLRKVSLPSEVPIPVRSAISLPEKVARSQPVRPALPFVKSEDNGGMQRQAEAPIQYEDKLENRTAYLVPFQPFMFEPKSGSWVFELPSMRAGEWAERATIERKLSPLRSAVGDVAGSVLPFSAYPTTTERALEIGIGRRDLELRRIPNFHRIVDEDSETGDSRIIFFSRAREVFEGEGHKKIASVQLTENAKELIPAANDWLAEVDPGAEPIETIAPAVSISVFASERLIREVESFFYSRSSKPVQAAPNWIEVTRVRDIRLYENPFPLQMTYFAGLAGLGWHGKPVRSREIIEWNREYRTVPPIGTPYFARNPLNLHRRTLGGRGGRGRR